MLLWHCINVILYCSFVTKNMKYKPMHYYYLYLTELKNPMKMFFEFFVYD